MVSKLREIATKHDINPAELDARLDIMINERLRQHLEHVLKGFSKTGKTWKLEKLDSYKEYQKRFFTKYFDLNFDIDSLAYEDSLIRDYGHEEEILECLPEKQKKICRLLNAGYTRREIAKTLGYKSEKSVGGMVAKIRHKIDKHLYNID